MSKPESCLYSFLLFLLQPYTSCCFWKEEKNTHSYLISVLCDTGTFIRTERSKETFKTGYFYARFEEWTVMEKYEVRESEVIVINWGKFSKSCSDSSQVSFVFEDKDAPSFWGETWRALLIWKFLWVGSGENGRGEMSKWPSCFCFHSLGYHVLNPITNDYIKFVFVLS